MTFYQVTEWPDWIATSSNYHEAYSDPKEFGLFRKAMDWGEGGNELGISKTILKEGLTERPKEDQ